MEINYFKQLQINYPEKEELFRWLNIKLDRNIYFFGPNFKTPQGYVPKKNIRWWLRKLYYFYIGKKCSYDHAVICDAYFNVGKLLKENGYKVELPPWINDKLSPEAMRTAQRISITSTTDFNELISEDLKEKVYRLKDELINFFLVNHTPFVLFANGEQPLYRICIDACKEIGVPTGVFLHGLPARYNFNDNYRPDYLFVWGPKIKENFENIGIPSKILVVGHPTLSQYRVVKKSSENILVLTQAINFTSCSQGYLMSDPGLTIQYIYAVENVLKSLGYTHAILRPHPSESLKWYEQRMDREFYSLDTKPLNETLSNVKFIVGSISTVVLNAVYSDIPYYVYIINPLTNKNTIPTVNPFSSGSAMPVSFTEEELIENIKNSHKATKEHFDGYMKDSFDISQITKLIK